MPEEACLAAAFRSNNQKCQIRPVRAKRNSCWFRSATGLEKERRSNPTPTAHFDSFLLVSNREYVEMAFRLLKQAGLANTAKN